MHSQATEATSLSSAQASEFEDVESGACCPFVNLFTKFVMTHELLFCYKYFERICDLL